MKILMKGNEAIAEAALRAGCECFFGYPITPQTELLQYMAKKLLKSGGVFIQAESEVGAINMAYGASSCGKRVMTSSSGPGISLKQEGISYLAGAQLPCVIVNIMRGGPGLGNINAAQSDYLQATKGGGHGDYKVIVLAPSSVQEAVELTMKAFDLADKYRNPVMILGDGMLGQMMEVVEFDENYQPQKVEKPWAVTGERNREKRVTNSLYIVPEELEKHNFKLKEKYKKIKENEVMLEEYLADDARVIFVSFGMCARIVKSAVNRLRQAGEKVGLVRPITLWPFPENELKSYALKEEVEFFIDIEMNLGQMLEDVKLSVEGKKTVHFYGRTGGMVPTIQEIIDFYYSLKK
ncbi:2-oxoglutarate ferredoxin oxidoreductase subunit alpha [Caldicellulosiruptor bescii]|uniref:Pyruvate flavodoxin/ferredoxin oxidoreductase domain protein n=2 Tax=Caldicellulosiruptor bescii TaxID=31899 RepID=B9MR93_CALBD|nr:3-methyl-2-oxobutanoate dehydrogenase subunit VorB [Caldicellulosiruptor bescii]ACM60197.1 pyruvate flavodoxin/ferredoxin oxidoreductase domain protein [Caldicellulosiruptor bescii DSM 6725]PBC87612.1 2-oxoglutarate ferredoxin oxidoreductase subunit alpha [Caldicellulosiruptor bescii]PBC90545.1 2-oxoglutarate ferredoxin oxidoreductase subunit alpha [Caldicellulosiruptor bescii]PBD04023.1 2-oxoglutarate ferredoxin oxidoreductase subunit alpha [Caldicellulosiruptor bescii]PBD06342.1 2-oxoglut